MKESKGKLISLILVLVSVISINTYTCAHSGRTDSRGGHKDNKNKSGLGSYHYHCGGNPAHLHKNGICPYVSSSSSNKSSTSTSSSSKTTTKVSSTVAITGIQINETIESIEIGKTKKITATITPSNATDKTIKWKSGNEAIATVSSDGEINAIKSGIVNITATTSNGKTNTIKLDVKEEPKTISNEIKTTRIQNNTSKISTIPNNNTISNISNSDHLNALIGILLVGLVGGGSYLAYKKYRSNKK